MKNKIMVLAIICFACLQAVGDIAVFRDGSVSGLSLDVADAVIGTLQDRGFTVSAVTASDLSDASTFDHTLYDTLILTWAPGFPLAAKDNFIDFLAHGGDVVFMGGDFPTLDVPSSEVFINIYTSDYDAYVLKNVVGVSDYEQQSIVESDVDVAGAFTGLWAIAPVIENEAKLVPLLKAYDQYGRDCGPAASLRIEYPDFSAFSDSHWLVYGITESSFYLDQQILDHLADTIYAMKWGSLSANAQAENAQRANETLTIVSPDRDKIVINNGRFEDQSGQEVFLTGANYRLGMVGFPTSGYFDQVEKDFQKASEYGINWLRVMGLETFVADPVWRNALLECARKYGIYIMPDVDHGSYLTESALIARGEQVGAAFAGENMLLGYDLRNEPYYWVLDDIANDNGELLVDLYPHNTRAYGAVDYIENFLEAYAVPPEQDYGWHGACFPGITAAHAGGSFKDQLPSVGVFPTNANCEPFYNDINSIYGQWEAWLIQGLHTYDPGGYTTVGYNSINSLWPSNSQLDFMSQHCYRDPASPKDVEEIYTTLDRIEYFWNDKPRTIGEFGICNGKDYYGNGFPSLEESGIVEAAVYFGAYANGHSGVKKWQLNEWLVPVARRLNTWLDYYDINKHTQVRYGMFYFDGTAGGRPKPTAHALKFFRKYVDEYANIANRGQINVFDDTNNILGAGYEYVNDNARFVGASSYNGMALMEYNLDEVSGNVAADSSGNGNDGTIVNAPGDDSQWVAGADGGGLYLDGTDYLDTDVPVTGDNSYTITCYVSGQNTLGTTNTVYSEFKVGVQSLFAMRCDAGKLNVWLQDDSGTNAVNLTSVYTVFDDAWHHVALVNDSGNVTLYVDGQLDSTASYNPGAFAWTAPDKAYVGARGYWVDGTVLDHYTGKIDEFAAYYDALTQADITEIIQTGAPQVPLSYTCNVPVNVMTMWDDDTMEIMATSDVMVDIKPSVLAGWSSDQLFLKGFNGGYSQSDGELSIQLLTGEFITIRNYNSAPYFNQTLNLTAAYERQQYSYSVAGFGVDDDAGDVLSYSLVNTPAWLTISPGGVISGMPELSDSGINAVTIRIQDQWGSYSEQTIELFVYSIVDIDFDRRVDFKDFSVLANNWGNIYSLAVGNFSFESPLLRDGSAYTFPPDSWQGNALVFNPDTSQFDTFFPGQQLPDGEQIIKLDGSVIYQDTANIITGGVEYRISADVGLPVGGASGQLILNLFAWDGSTESLILEKTIDYSSLSQGAWETVTQNSIAASGYTGQQIRVKISGNSSMYLDNVRLSAGDSLADFDDSGAVGLGDLSMFSQRWLLYSY